jgi:DNA-binding transcriptional LysR family regulator
MEADATALGHAARAVDVRATGVVRVATTEAVGVHLVQQGLLGLREHHPDVLVEIIGGNRPLDLARGEADIAVRLSKVTDSSLRVRCVARLAIGLFASPDYVRTRGRPRTSRELRGHDVVVPGAELANLPEARWLAARPGVRVTFRSSSMAALAAAAGTGAGIVALTAPWGDGDPALERLFVIDELPKRAVWLVTSSEGALGPAVRVVADRIATIYGRGA